ncbi:MAG: hypothetical protein AAF566_13215, partial [Pseudomonadota bacterium]
DYQAEASFQYPASLTNGVFISRFRSNYNGTDGKVEVEAGNPLNWSLHDSLVELDGAGLVTRRSAQNLVAGTPYVGLHFWINDTYYDLIFVQGTNTLQDAINADAVWPTGNDVMVTPAVTISAIVTPATDIGGSFAAATGAGAGVLLGTATANRTNGSFSEGTPALSWVDVAPNGQLTVASGQTAPAAGNYLIGVVYDNTAAGGGAYSETMTISVREATGATDKFIPMPPVNANGGVYFSSVNALKTALENLDNNWNATMSGWGLANSGVEPVLGLAAGQYGDINWSNLGPYPERVTIRGAGPFSRTSYVPTAGTKVGRLIWNNCDDMRLMGVEAEPSSVNTTYNGNNHRVLNCNRSEWVRNAIFGEVARSQSALSTTPKAGVQVLIWIDESYDCKFMHNVLMGSRECVIGKSPNLHADRIEFRGNVMAQNHNDLVKFGTSVTDDWILADNIGFGKGRNSGEQHRDFVQVLGTNGTGYARNWLIEGNWVQSKTAWGADTYLAKQAFYWGAGAAGSRATIVDNFIGSPGKGIQSHHGGAQIRFNTFFIPIETLSSETSANWTANFTGINGQPTCDENIVFAFSGDPTAYSGPNGIGIKSAGFVSSDHPTLSGQFDWSQMGQFLENFDQTWTTNVKTQVSPREEGGVEQYIPKVGTRAHWTHNNPTGCFQLFKRVFDTVDHDHWKDWGWPTAPAAHLYHDTTNAMGGASGTYQNFDGDGVYLG